MGGQNEDTIDVGAQAAEGGTLDPEIGPSGSVSIPTVAPLSQKIRYHESGGKIHFHFDDEGLKVEVPVAEWWGIWQQLKNMRISEWTFMDHGRGTLLHVSAGLDEGGKFDVCPTVRKVTTGSGAVFQKLDEFTTKCGK